MPVVPDINGYFKSLANELLSQYQRVRHLIGDKHWLSDGHHKEYLLATLLDRHMPSNVLISRGFVTDPSTPGLCSKEQDILIVDTRFQAPIFNQGSLIVALPKTVIASISVKSKMKSATILQTIENQNTVRDVCATTGLVQHQPMCIGYFFEADDSIAKDPSSVYKDYENGVRKHSLDNACFNIPRVSRLGPELICCGSDFIYCADFKPCDIGETQENRILGYQCSGCKGR